MNLKDFFNVASNATPRYINNPTWTPKLLTPEQRLNKILKNVNFNELVDKGIAKEVSFDDLDDLFGDTWK